MGERRIPYSEAQFRLDIAPLIEALRKHLEAEDEALLSMHPGNPNRQEMNDDRD